LARVNKFELARTRCGITTLFHHLRADVELRLARRVVRRLLDRRDGKGVVLITHDRSLAELCEASLYLAQR
jgi:ABC-type lipoprotein export system ATPase subunit